MELERSEYGERNRYIENELTRKIYGKIPQSLFMEFRRRGGIPYIDSIIERAIRTWIDQEGCTDKYGNLYKN